MRTDIKFCGLTRPEDAELAVELGAAYVGVIFAGGPRMLTVGRAADVLASVPATVKRVGVFADQPIAEIHEVIRSLRLDVVQLHSTPSPDRITALRSTFHGDVWTVCRLSGTTLPADIETLIGPADGLLLDAHVAGTLGGTGVTLPWASLASAVAPLRSKIRLVLAGGLRPENVGQAIAALDPHVVDVSSGVESSPGIKDHDRMRAFRDAVLAVPTVHVSLKP